MKNILKAIAIIIAIIAAFSVGHNRGMHHVIEDSEFFIVSYNDSLTINGHKYDTRVYIDIDGDVYEEGLYIG